VGGQDPASVPWSPLRIATEYDRLGAYEASKVESDAVVQAAAHELGAPLTIANPSTVIGHSVTGKSAPSRGVELALGPRSQVRLVQLGRLVPTDFLRRIHQTRTRRMRRKSLPVRCLRSMAEQIGRLANPVRRRLDQ